MGRQFVVNALGSFEPQTVSASPSSSDSSVELSPSSFPRQFYSLSAANGTRLTRSVSMRSSGVFRRRATLRPTVRDVIESCLEELSVVGPPQQLVEVSPLTHFLLVERPLKDCAKAPTRRTRRRNKSQRLRTIAARAASSENRRRRDNALCARKGISLVREYRTFKGSFYSESLLATRRIIPLDIVLRTPYADATREAAMKCLWVLQTQLPLKAANEGEPMSMDVNQSSLPFSKESTVGAEGQGGSSSGSSSKAKDEICMADGEEEKEKMGVTAAASMEVGEA
eukprot:CAMPEP_0184349826 /NCGR_PEP_ID=MMETSP1089-20130417/37286_1 /TAXON_ID=38269 ORGANISM="Gloeochaete wittrockiana, Strain SAG46.84" /NCGR_SAMPLE_ID=MMETSP1089 /ASSEMBLY_ACC=CAM_ASM_000445 /LENGTH=282 /DNA_ID=CAMNT_0026682297 /DNA_START=254 /DNA_END=1098 /DNA_ORIENTATION=-